MDLSIMTTSHQKDLRQLRISFQVGLSRCLVCSMPDKIPSYPLHKPSQFPIPTTISQLLRKQWANDFGFTSGQSDAGGRGSLCPLGERKPVSNLRTCNIRQHLSSSTEICGSKVVSTTRVDSSSTSYLLNNCFRGMGCACSKASQPSRPPTLLDESRPTLLGSRNCTTGTSPQHLPRHALLHPLPQAKPTDTRCQATEGACEGADVNVPSSVSGGAMTAEAESSLKPDLAVPVLEGEEDPSRNCSWFCCSKACRASTQTQSLESWELHLLRVSSELKMKLKDPHFVAKRCDLDSSGDLDMHELKQATRAFGMKFSSEELRAFMAGEARITKERLAHIVKDAPVTSAGRSRPTIPHSLRGMALGQLQQLESIFITSGWLSEKCNAFNLDYADAIREGKKFPQAANLYAMDTFVVTPMSQPGKCDARDQDSANMVPETNEMMSFSEVVNPYGLIVHCFVSHFWGHLFSQTVTALRRWAEMNCERIGVESPKSMVFWICLFALNQHAVADEVGENPMQGPFNAALAQAESGAVMVLDEEINPFKRIWCLFEISRLKELNQPLELICEMGSLSKPESLAVQQADPAAVECLLQATCEALWQVSALKAKASVKEDEIRILKEIANPGLRKMLKGCKGTAKQSATLPEGWFSEFDQFSQALLSSALLQFCLMHNHYTAAATCCEKGACFTKEQFPQINTHVREEDRTRWLSKLLLFNTKHNRVDIVGLLLQSGVCMEGVHHSLICAAQGGHEAVTKLLLDHGANVAAADIHGATALIYAAFDGSEAVAKLLLDHGANVAAAANDGSTALTATALVGHEAVAKLLLDNGANVASADNNDEKTALICAAAGGHEAVTKLLLDNGSNVATAANNGRTALYFAAFCGHEAVTKLLLDHGADVASADNDGVTALMLSAQGGHEAVTKLLLDNGSNVAAASKDGSTALMLALAGGHEAVAKLLLENGANVAAADMNGATALMLSAQGGHEAVTKLLLDNGSNVAAASKDGSTALMLALAGGHEAVAKLLLENGADVASADNDGVTALMLSAQSGHEAVTKLLLDNGSNVAAASTDGSTALMLALAGGHEAVAKLLLENGANVAAADMNGATALMLSAAGGHEAVAQLLLENGANVAAADKNGVTALMISAQGGHEAVAKVLLDHDADVDSATDYGATALMVAAQCGHEAVAKLLLDSGADVAVANTDGSTALMASAQSGHEAVTKLLLDHDANVAAAHNHGRTAIIYAAVGGSEAVAKLLLENGADVASADNDGDTALMLSAQGGHEAVTKLLLDHGANVATAANNGRTAVIYAAVGGSEAVAKLLLDHGADVASADYDGVTALMLSAQGGYEAVAKVLLDHDADVDSATDYGATALMVAAQCGHEAVAKLLLDSGADVAVANTDGFTALMASAQSGHEAVTKLLLDHDANVAAAAKNGATALLLALAGGHLAVAKLLMESPAAEPYRFGQG